MAIKGIDIQKIIEENKTKNKSVNNNQPDKVPGILSMANNPMVQMAIKNIPKKYKVMILMAFVFIVIGIGSTVYDIVQSIRMYPMISLKSISGIIGLSFSMSTIIRIAKNKAKALRIIITILADTAILYWIIFFG